MDGMTLAQSAWNPFDDRLNVESWVRGRWFRIAVWLMIGGLSVAKFLYLSADFPNESPWMIDQAKFTDEGWWASAAVRHFLTGDWYMAGDYNPAVALPIWPVLLGMVFHFTGVSAVAARALNVAISIATLAVVFLLVRRFSSAKSVAPLIAVLLLSASPFAFAFNRLAILDTPVVFEFCLLLYIASIAGAKRIRVCIGLAVLMTAMVLTKTTPALLAPAVMWVAWSAMGRRAGNFVWVLAAVALVPGALLKWYEAVVGRLGYGADYRYFFDVNGMPDIEWGQTFSTLRDFFQNCFWIDRVLFPVCLLILVLTLAWIRKLWRNPLFVASWMTLAAEAAFIFSRQDDYAPRYFLVMLAPLAWIAALTFEELLPSFKKTAGLLLLVLIASVVANTVMVGGFLTHRDYDFRDAAAAIGEIVRSHPEQKPLLVGVSANQISLMTGIPSINDGFGTEERMEKILRNGPGWYLAWKDAADERDGLLTAFQLEKMASYEAFDDDERGDLTLYRMVRHEGELRGAGANADQKNAINGKLSR